MGSQNEELASLDKINEETELSDTPGFYSVFIAPDIRAKETSINQNIFKDKIEALKLVKKSKKARFKYFEFYHEALKFALSGTLEPSGHQLNGSVKHITLTSQVVNERLSPFKGPKPQDLVKLRKLIENGDMDGFRTAIWDNPRYLVSSGDTPSILQEGFRYNALHVAAKAKNGVIAELILNTVSNPRFVKLLYGDDQNENVENRTQVLLDLYLNTPDKGLNETPLHFAAKFGAADVVEVLVSFPECDKTLKNKYGQTADMIICDRCNNKDADVTKKIALHLENSYYVPVLRAEDNSVTPLIGEPFSPGEPPVTNKDPLSPRLEIHAYAGPMNKENADQFRKVWKTPPRTSTPIKRKVDKSLDSVVSLRYTDPAKGLERLGQKLANKFDVNWREYWSFLDCFIDITSDEGLGLLEDFLTARVNIVDELYMSSPEDTSSKSFSTIADLCAQLQNCNINEDPNEDDNFNAFLCVEKACNVFANRIAVEIYQRSCLDCSTQFMLLEGHVKQVELLVTSYLDDSRFNKVNFKQLHPRLGYLAGRKMCHLVGKPERPPFIDGVKKVLTACLQTFDCYSSDDEAKDTNPSSSKKQVICLLQNFLENFAPDTEPKRELHDEKLCRHAWHKTKECSCVYPLKKTRKSLGLSRNHSRHLSMRSSRKVLFKKEEAANDSSDEEFYTPVGTPSQLSDSDSEDQYAEAPLMRELFLEGVKPTRTDNALYRALKYSDCVISPAKYPNIYRWYHNVNLYTDAARESWPRPKMNDSRCSGLVSPPRPSTPKVSFHTPSSSSWLRITGMNSPGSGLQGKTNM